MPRLRTPLAALLTIVAVVACGGSAGTPVGKETARELPVASLMLDFTPNAIHTGIYTATARRYDLANGIHLQIRIPGASTDAISLLTAGRVNFAVLDIHDLAIADEQGHNLVGIMALEQRPLASVIAQPRFRSPKQLDGQTIGVTGAPSDVAVLRSVVAGAGGKPRTLHTLTIGYDAVPDLISGKVAAATSFWNDEGLQLSHQRPPFRVFRVENYGAPSYPELVVCTTAGLLRRDPGLAQGLVHALVAGYRYVLRHPGDGARYLEAGASGLSKPAVSQQLAVELPAFMPRGGGAYGSLEPSVLHAWARWEVRFGIVKRTPDLAKMFDRSFLPR